MFLCESLECGYDKSHDLFLQLLFPLWVVRQDSRIPVPFSDLFQRLEESSELVLDSCLFVFCVIGKATQESRKVGIEVRSLNALEISAIDPRFGDEVCAPLSFGSLN